MTVSDLLELVGRGPIAELFTSSRALSHRTPLRKSKGVVAASALIELVPKS